MSTGKIGNISVRITADTKQFTRSMKNVTARMASSAKQLRQSSLAYQQWATVGVAAAAAIGVAMVKNQMKELDVLAKTADALKVNQKELQALQHVAELTGTGAQQLSTNLERMQRRIGEIARKGGPAGKALDEIGLSAKEMINLSADQQLVKISQAMGSVENASIRASISMDLFGRDGVRMLKMMEQLSKDGLKPTVDELNAMGVSLSRLDTAKVEQANDALFKSGEVLNGITNKITVKLSPLIEQLSNDFTDVSKETGGFGEVIDEVFNDSIKVVGVFADGLHGIKIIFKALEVAARGIAVVFWKVFEGITIGQDKMVNAVISGINMSIEAMNKMPGVSLPILESFASDAAAEFARISSNASNLFATASAELQALGTQELPSTAIGRWVKEAEDAAQTIAELAIGGIGSDDGSESGNVNIEDGSGDTFSVDTRTMNLDQLREGLKTKQQILKEDAELELLMLAESLENGELLKAEYDEIKKAREATLAKDLLDIKQQAIDKEIALERAKTEAIDRMKESSTSLAIGLLNQFAGKNKAAAIASIALSKGMSLAKNAQNTLVAQTRALAELGPIAGPAAAATIGTYGSINAGLIAATGLAQASKALKGGGRGSSVKSSDQNSTSNSGGGSGGGGDRNISIAGIDANSLISGGQLVDTLNQALGDGYTVNFAGG